MGARGWLGSPRRHNAGLAQDLETLWWPARTPAGRALSTLVAATLVGLCAAGATTFAFTETKFVIALCLGLVGALGFLLSGNQRLFLLYAVLLLAPLKLGKDFMPIGHQGGAGSFVIDAADPFWLMLVVCQFNDWRKGRLSHYRVPFVIKLWLGMMALGLFSIAFGAFKTSAAHEVVRMAKYVVYVLVLINELKRRKQFRHVALALFLGVAIQSSFSAVSYATGSQLGLEFLGEETEENVEELGAATLKGDFAIRRPGGLMGHPNQFAGYLALIMPMGIALLFSPISLVEKALFVATLLVGQVGLLLTLSRSGWICFAVGLMGTLALSFLHRSSRRRYLLARALVIALVAMVGIAASPKIIERIQHSDPESWRARMEMIDISQSIIADHPLFGIGLNSYVFAQPPYTRHRTYEGMQEFYGDNVPVVHSTWMLTWAEQGTVGMVLFVLIHLCVLWVGFNNLRLKDGFLHAMNAGLLSGFFAIMLDGMVSFFARMEVGGRMFWIVIALILAIGYWRRTHEARAARIAAARPAEAPGTRGPRQWIIGGGRRTREWLSG